MGRKDDEIDFLLLGGAQNSMSGISVGDQRASRVATVPQSSYLAIQIILGALLVQCLKLENQLRREVDRLGEQQIVVDALDKNDVVLLVALGEAFLEGLFGEIGPVERNQDGFHGSSPLSWNL